MTGAPGKASYAYDGNGKRLKTTLANGTIEYAFYTASGKLLYTRKGTGATIHVDFDGKALAEHRAILTYLHPSWLGSPRLATNSNG